MPIFQGLAGVMDVKTDGEKARKATPAARPTKPPFDNALAGPVRGPSKNPGVMAAVEAAKKRADANLKKR